MAQLGYAEEEHAQQAEGSDGMLGRLLEEIAAGDLAQLRVDAFLFGPLGE